MTGCSTELLAELLQVKLSTEAIADLCKTVTSEEIKDTMNDINGIRPQDLMVTHHSSLRLFKRLLVRML